VGGRIKGLSIEKKAVGLAPQGEKKKETGSKKKKKTDRFRGRKGGGKCPGNRRGKAFKGEKKKKKRGLAPEKKKKRAWRLSLGGRGAFGGGGRKIKGKGKEKIHKCFSIRTRLPILQRGI